VHDDLSQLDRRLFVPGGLFFILSVVFLYSLQLMLDLMRHPLHKRVLTKEKRYV